MLALALPFHEDSPLETSRAFEVLLNSPKLSELREYLRVSNTHPDLPSRNFKRTSKRVFDNIIEETVIAFHRPSINGATERPNQYGMSDSGSGMVIISNSPAFLS